MEAEFDDTIDGYVRRVGDLEHVIQILKEKLGMPTDSALGDLSLSATTHLDLHTRSKGGLRGQEAGGEDGVPLRTPKRGNRASAGTAYFSE
jgi:hypothetical protein